MNSFVAFGSNLGNRLGFITRALALLNQGSTRILSCSPIYESKPMYFENQGNFLNGVVHIKTQLNPVQLLKACKSIEHSLGRRKTIDNGPREIDLDILIYDNLVLNDRKIDLIIPHPRIAEREFVLRPLADLAPDIIVPTLNKTPDKLLDDLMAINESQLQRSDDTLQILTQHDVKS